MRIVIPGGTGQVGQILARHFHSQGHDVTVLTRTPQPAPWAPSPDPGGVFDVLLSLVRHGLAGITGSGRQFVSWIHEVNFIRAVEVLIAQEDFVGIVNLASPNPLPTATSCKPCAAPGETSIGLPAAE
jgi:NAD dependent epimerase/dehydratase family enzyme